MIMAVAKAESRGATGCVFLTEWIDVFYEAHLAPWYISSNQGPASSGVLGRPQWGTKPKTVMIMAVAKAESRGATGLGTPYPPRHTSSGQKQPDFFSSFQIWFFSILYSIHFDGIGSIFLQNPYPCFNLLIKYYN